MTRVQMKEADPMDATDRQRDHLESLGVRTIPRTSTIAAPSRRIDEPYEEETDEVRDEEMGWSNCAGVDSFGHQPRNWSTVRLTAILLTILGIGWLVYELVNVSGTMLR
jgi:hypothetical protein